jgi:opacity protein-like surface antigen
MTKRVPMLILACVLGLPAAAQEAYIGASYLDTSGEFDTSAGTFSADDSGWKIFAGYLISPSVAAEITYYDLGSFEDSEGFNSFRANVNAYDLAFRGILPLGERFELFAKIGYSLVDVNSSLSGPIVSTSVDATDWEFIYGAGLAFKIGPKFGLRAEYEGWDTNGELDAFSVGAYFRYGTH